MDEFRQHSYGTGKIPSLMVPILAYPTPGVVVFSALQDTEMLTG